MEAITTHYLHVNIRRPQWQTRTRSWRIGNRNWENVELQKETNGERYSRIPTTKNIFQLYYENTKKKQNKKRCPTGRYIVAKIFSTVLEQALKMGQLQHNG